MDRKELKEFFETHYNTKFIPPLGKEIVIDEKKRRVMEVAMKGLEEWFDNYFELIFDTRTKNQTNVSTQTIASPFQRAVPIIDKTKATTVIVNSYFDYLVNVQCPQYADGKTRKRVRRAVYNDFVKGKYFSNKIGNKLYEMITKVVR